jgi:Endonuclease NucS
MVEREMQELLWKYPERLLDEPLKQFAWETASDVGRADLVFEDRHGRLLIIEVKRGKLPRGAIDQLLDYFGMMKERFPEKAVELMVVANAIPSERRLTCESRDIECREISERRFRDVAGEVSYIFASEANLPQLAPETPLSRQDPRIQQTRKDDSSWPLSRAVDSTAEAQDFLSRCDEEGRNFFTSLFAAQQAASSRTRITWKHESGFSLQFFFHSIGFAPIVWGFPAKARDGKRIRQRLDFPFDVSLKAGVPEALIKEFGASLSSGTPLSGGEKRPSMSISALNSDASARIIETLFSFVGKASQK